MSGVSCSSAPRFPLAHSLSKPVTSDGTANDLLNKDVPFSIHPRLSRKISSKQFKFFAAICGFPNGERGANHAVQTSHESEVSYESCQIDAGDAATTRRCSRISSARHAR